MQFPINFGTLWKSQRSEDNYNLEYEATFYASFYAMPGAAEKQQSSSCTRRDEGKSVCPTEQSVFSSLSDYYEYLF